MFQKCDRKTITGHVKTTPDEAISSEADLPTVATSVTQLSTIAMVRSFRMPDTNPRTPPAHEEDKFYIDGQQGLEIYHWVHATRKVTADPTTLATNRNPRYQVDGSRSGDAENVKIWALQRHTM